MILDIVILPPKGVSVKIGKFIRELSREFKLKMAVDNKKLLPHISLFHIQTTEKNIARIVRLVGQISQKHFRQNLEFAKPKIGKDYFVLNLVKDKKLTDLHRKAVFMIYKYRTGFSGVGNPKGKKLEKQYIKKYGAGNILKNFQPHITLGLAKNSQDLRRIILLVSKLRLGKFTPLENNTNAAGGKQKKLSKYRQRFNAAIGSLTGFKANRLAIGQVNNRHQVFKIIKEFKLQ